MKLVRKTILLRGFCADFLASNYFLSGMEDLKGLFMLQSSIQHDVLDQIATFNWKLIFEEVIS